MSSEIEVSSIRMLVLTGRMGLAVVLQVREVTAHRLCSHAAIWGAAAAHQDQPGLWNAAHSGSDRSLSVHLHGHVHHRASMLERNRQSVAPAAWMESLVQYLKRVNPLFGEEPYLVTQTDIMTSLNILQSDSWVEICI